MVVGHVGSAGGHRFFRQTELTGIRSDAGALFLTTKEDTKNTKSKLIPL
jgi:hypothetical protein